MDVCTICSGSMYIDYLVWRRDGRGEDGYDKSAVIG